MIDLDHEFQSEKKIIQVMSNFSKNIKPEIRRHNEEVMKLFENKLKNAIWQAGIRGIPLSRNEYYGIVKEFWKKYYIYEV